MKSIYAFIIFISLLLNSNISFANNVKQLVDCNNEPEEASKLTKVVELKEFEIKVTIPLNFRAMATQDGVMILDNGTYTEVIKFTGNYFFSNIYEKIPDKEIYIVWKKNQEIGIHELSLRLKTKIGIIEIRNVIDGNLGEGDVPSEIEDLIQMAKGIQIL
jgi:hypothetical protein